MLGRVNDGRADSLGASDAVQLSSSSADPLRASWPGTCRYFAHISLIRFGRAPAPTRSGAPALLVEALVPPSMNVCCDAGCVGGAAARGVALSAMNILLFSCQSSIVSISQASTDVWRLQSQSTHKGDEGVSTERRPSKKETHEAFLDAVVGASWRACSPRVNCVVRDVVEVVALLDGRHHRAPLAAHALRVALHDAEVGADGLGEVLSAARGGTEHTMCPEL